MAEDKSDNGTTTVRISKAHNAKLGKLTKQFGLSRQEFLEYSVMYFSRPGKDPREATEAGIMDRLGEMEKVLKRFQSDWHASKNSWEKSYLKPSIQADVQLFNMLDKLTNSESGAKGNDLTEFIGILMMLVSLGNSGAGNEDLVINNFRLQFAVLKGVKPDSIDIERVFELGKLFLKTMTELKSKQG